MALEFSNAHHDQLDQFLASVLDAYKAGTIDRGSAIRTIAQAVASAAKDDEGLYGFIRVPPEKLWRKD